MELEKHDGVNGGTATACIGLLNELTHEGEIESEFDEIKVDNRGRESSASGSIGTNGPRLVMNCEKGTIEIRKGTVAVVSPTPLAAPGKAGKPAKTLPAPKAKLVETEKKEVDSG